MRLLYFDQDDIRISDDRSDHKQPYAILSHTWGNDNEEVTFQDVRTGRARDKTGYDKILFCGQQARRHGIDRFWVDTCCINKDSQSELAEAIISMFRWYQNAARCYVYLSDVTMKDCDQELKDDWRGKFQESRWFKRGWTLQELVAPQLVEFYSCDKQYLGDKFSLRDSITTVTGIPNRALWGTNLESFDLGQRLSWADKRKTTKVEDRIYCLTGLFNVSICVRYGEGLENALLQLVLALGRCHRTQRDSINNLLFSEPLADISSSDERIKSDSATSLIEICRRTLSARGITSIFEYDELHHRLVANSHEIELRMTDEIRSIGHMINFKAQQSHSPEHSLSDVQQKTYSKENQSEEVKERLLQSLGFSDMNTRINQITTNESGTFGWIYTVTEKDSHVKRWSNFSDWLSNGTGLYWIHGKAGSGKSTLMKYLWTNEQTAALLTKNAAVGQSCILKYSFWLSGSPQQRSIDGCYRSLLYQILGLSHSGLRQVLEESPSLLSKQYYGDWPLVDLEETLFAFTICLVKDMPVAFFIDGLDEIEGRNHYHTFTTMLRRLISSAGVKVCISSRRESYWTNQFANEAQLCLEDHIADDIRKFVVLQLEQEGHSGLEEDRSFQIVIDTICTKAEGVFLWINLAVKSILQALDGMASWNEILEMINLMPTGIANLYESMLAKQGALTTQTRKEAAMYFKMCQSGILDHMIDFANIKMKMGGMDLLSQEYSLKKLRHTAELLCTRIPHVTAGMIECKPGWPTDKHDPLNFDVAFCHRSVKDFLTDFEAGKTLLRDCYFDDEKFLQIFAEGRLGFALVNCNSDPFRNLASCIEAVRHLEDSLDFCFLPDVLLRVSKYLDDKVDQCSTNPGLLEPGYIGKSQQSQVASDATIVMGTFVQRMWRPNNIWRDLEHCVDVPGICSSLNIKDYIQHLLDGRSISPDLHGVSLNSSYKDYLLLCAIKCEPRIRNMSCDHVMLLMDAGANPFADIFLPVVRAERYCAAVELIRHFTNRFSISKVHDYAKLIDRMCATKNKKLMYWMWCIPELTRNDPRSKFYMGESSVFRAELPYNRYKHEKYGIMVQTPIVCQLEHLLRSLSEVKEIGHARIVYPSLKTIAGKPWITRVPSGPYPKVAKVNMMPLTTDEYQAILEVTEAVSEHQCQLRRGEIEFDEGSMDYDKIFRQFREVYHAKPRSQGRDLLDLLKEYDYVIEESDPRLPRLPLERFETTDIVHH